MNKDVALLRQAIAGITALITQRGLKVTQQGTEAYVEKHPKTHQPVRVNIPYLPDNASPELVLAIQGFVDHECGHVLDTDYAVWGEVERWANDMRARGVPGGFSMWNIVEDTFIERCMAKRFRGSEYNLERLHDFFVTELTGPKLADAIKAGNEGMIFNLLLVPMCRAWTGQPVFVRFMADKWHLVAGPVAKVGALKDRFPDLKNSRETFALAQELVTALYVKPKEPKAEKPKPVEEEAKAVEPPKAPEPKKEPEPKPEPKEEAKEPEPTPEPEEDEEEPTPAEASEEADEEPEADEAEEGEEGEPEPSEAAGEEGEGEDEDEADAGAGAGDDEDEEGESAEADEENDGEGEGEDADGEASLGDAEESGRPEEGDWDDEKDAANTEIEIENAGGAPKGGSGEIDETHGPTPLIEEGVSGFDEQLSSAIGGKAAEISRISDYLVYTKDNDEIEPYKVSGQYNDRYLTRLDDETRSMVGVMQKDIERMMAARSQVIRVGGYRSGRLRGGALHRLRTHDDRVFERKHEAQSKDVAVTLLIDNSGSMSSGAKIKTAMTAGYALSLTLDRVGIKHEVLGFTTGTKKGAAMSWQEAEKAMQRIGRRYSRLEPIRMPIFKGDNEKMTPEVRRRFADAMHHSNMANNIDGESVEYAALRLAQKRAERKVLIVLSDGQPAGGGVGRDLQNHLRKTVREVGKAGIECIGIGIQTDAVRQYYPRHIVLHNASELPAKVMGELKRILMAA